MQNRVIGSISSKTLTFTIYNGFWQVCRYKEQIVIKWFFRKYRIDTNNRGTINLDKHWFCMICYQWLDLSCRMLFCLLSVKDCHIFCLSLALHLLHKIHSKINSHQFLCPPSTLERKAPIYSKKCCQVLENFLILWFEKVADICYWN